MLMASFQAIGTRHALLRSAGRMLGIAALALLAACSRGDDPAAAGSKTAPPPGQSITLPALQGAQPTGEKRPRWVELTPAQRQALAPLAAEWDQLDAIRKKKWLEIAARYAQMGQEEQQRLQDRMREWAKLTPEQRRVARESYARAKKLDAGQKSAKWELYQSLPEEEKQKLAAKAEKKKNVVNLPRARVDLDKPAPTKSAPPVLPSAPAEPPPAPAPPAPLPTPAPLPPENHGVFPGG